MSGLPLLRNAEHFRYVHRHTVLLLDSQSHGMSPLSLRKESTVLDDSAERSDDRRPTLGLSQTQEGGGLRRRRPRLESFIPRARRLPERHDY